MCVFGSSVLAYECSSVFVCVVVVFWRNLIVRIDRQRLYCKHTRQINAHRLRLLSLRELHVYKSGRAFASSAALAGGWVDGCVRKICKMLVI